jgi:Tfp pilus assembly protein PilX
MRRPARPAQQGVTMLVVLVLLSVMLLGGMALARLTETGTLASGNTAFREASLQASEVGLNTAFVRVRDEVADPALPQTSWYWPTMQATDANGIPQVDFGAAPEVTVGTYSLRYVAERLCTVTAVTDMLRECLVKQEVDPTKSRSGGREALDSPKAIQYRITVRVTGPKDTQIFVQSLITKG